jgi:acyl-CoA reductase-like NAD-dependent aldehyde dehydrogenase
MAVAGQGSAGLTGVDRPWRLLIDGELSEAEGHRTLEVIAPATGAEVTRLPRASTGDVDRAVAAAKRAFASWRRCPAAERGRYVLALADAIEAHGEELAWLDTVDNGSPIRVMRGDYRIAVDQLRYFAGLALALKGESIPTPEFESIDFTLRDPYGVVARIIPFNHPLMFAASKLGAPLVAGNTVVLKPSQHTSLSALRLGELCAAALPPGVVNVLSGTGGEIGDHLVSHPDVPRIAFTGSVDVGRRIQQHASAERIKVVTLELGGKNPIIVFDDAEREDALAGVLRGMNFNWQGQSCGSTSRVYVQRSIYDDFVTGLGAAMASMRVGDPLDESTDVGAIVSRQQFESVARYIELGVAHPQARLVTGGPPAPDLHGRGFFIAPTLFAVDDDADFVLAREEIFGPVLVAVPFDDETEVMHRANALPFGLTASVWTSDLGRAMRSLRDLETGHVWVNWSSAHVPGASFGGVKDSGVGREEGADELFSYTQSKNVYIRFGK